MNILSSTLLDRLQWLVRYSLLVVVVLIPANVSLAQEPVAEGKTVSDEVEEVPPTVTVDLGMFSIRDYRPTRNETAKLYFSIHLAVTQGVSEKVAETLNLWNHRLRDQVIIAVRNSVTKDFQEPDLKLLRRRILLRVNRLLKKDLISEVLLTEFTFTTH